jgi:gliding motility-associated-like protein
MKFISFIIILISFSKISAQRVRNTYNLYNTLSTTEPNCTNDLLPARGLCEQCQSTTASTAGGFILDTLGASNISRPVYHNNLGFGLKYTNKDGVIDKTYTIQVYLKITNFNKFYTRVIDFSNGLDDDGIYFTNYNTPIPTDERCFNFFPTGNFGKCPFFKKDTYYLITITRNDLTKLIDIYVNNQLFTSYNDNTNFYVSTAGKPIHIFRDDPIGFACEDGEANFAYISFANYYFTISDVSFTYNNINDLVNTANFSVYANKFCEAENVTINYTGNIPANATQYQFNWDWGDAAVIMGSGRGPYTVTWPASGNKTVALTISGGGCNVPITNKKEILVGKQNAYSILDTCVCSGTTFDGYFIEGVYYDRYVTALGCDSIRNLKLSFKPCGIFFPNSFTPNGDGKNEIFIILGKNLIDKYDLKVYNRFGEIVFQTTNTNIGWDGNFKGKKAGMGLYIWYCSLKERNKENWQFLKGAITLIR